MSEGEKKQLKLMSWPVKLPSNMFNGFLMINHPPIEDACNLGWGKIPENVDVEFIKTICDEYLEHKPNIRMEAQSLTWDAIIPTHQEFIELIEARKYTEIGAYLSVMFSTPLTSGIAQGEFYYNRLKNDRDGIVSNTGFGIYDKFITLMESVGIIPTFSPERYQIESDFLKYYTISVDRYLDALEEHLGCKLYGPEFQGEHFGIQTERHGFFSDRDIMALGTAIRVSEGHWFDKDISICDLGGGVGYLIYWLYQLGFKNLTYVDLPTTTIGAKYFFKTNAPEIDVKYISPDEFDGNFDVVVNLDGLTTYGRYAADTYAAKISENTGHFLSINREHDEFRVFDIMNMRRVSRNPFWLRRGYIEENYVKT